MLKKCKAAVESSLAVPQKIKHNNYLMIQQFYS